MARRVLIVEDDVALRQILEEVLTDEGHEVRTAAHGGAALEVLADWKPDVVLLDLMMPHMDAFEFRRLATTLDDGPTKLVILSAARGIESAAERLRADAWLTKPFSVADVLESVDRLAL